MIPEISLPGVLTPMMLDKDPLIDINEVLGRFDYSIKESQILHLTDDILKPSIKKLLNDRGLIIEKIDVWRWAVDSQRNVPPHTDGKYSALRGRAAGLNWGLDNNSGVEFYDTNSGTTELEDVSDGRQHTLWYFPKGTNPIITWKNQYPSLINPQVPHKIIGEPGSYRHSITIKFLGNPSYDTVLKKLWDLREDVDFWPVDMSIEDFQILTQMVTRLEESMPTIDTGMSGYNLPRDIEFETFLKKFIKKPIKSMRIFNYKEGAGAKMHIDYDNTIKISPAYGLNIPIYGSDNCYINFYKNLGGIIERWEDSVGSFLWVSDESKVFPSSTLLINKPYLIRINIPHSVNIADNSKRKVLSIRFLDDTTSLPSEIAKLTN